MITVTLGGVDRTSKIDQDNFQVQQIIGAQRDTATLQYKKYGSGSYVPAVLDTVLIQDGSTKIFGGRVATIEQDSFNPKDGIIYKLSCVDYSIDLDSELVSNEYDNTSIHDIIEDFITNFATGFTGVNVMCTFVVPKIIFNQVPISQAIKKLADLVQYDWYVDADKDIHFFPKYTELSPFNLTDTSGNYVNNSLQTTTDGTQIANQVKVRGGTYVGSTFSDTITVKGSVTKSWLLPYKFDVISLTVTINGVSKIVGVYGQNDFTTADVLYRDADQSIQILNQLADGSTVAFSGTPLIPVLAIASDSPSIATYGVREKLIEDKNIVDLNVARQRAVAELTAYKDPLQGGQFDTYIAGLRTGQTININSTRRGVNTNYIIRAVTFAPRAPDTFMYTVELITVKTFTLMEILQSLLQPVALPIDPNEVSEIIKVDLGTVTITESIAETTTAGHTNTATVTIAETNIAHDPLGTGVSPLWRLGPYIPSSVSDTKRVINLDRSPADVY
jgi:hypothetical protein